MRKGKGIPSTFAQCLKGMNALNLAGTMQFKRYLNEADADYN